MTGQSVGRPASARLPAPAGPAAPAEPAEPAEPVGAIVPAGDEGLTLRSVLAMPVLRNADPAPVAATHRLDAVVRWVHTTELPDIAPLLRGGDLVLTTGIALPEDAAALTAFATSLADSQAAGLLLELGRRWSEVPEPLVRAAEAAGLPLVALRREVRFAAVAQAVGERLVDAQVRELRATHLVHETFTALGLAEAGPGEVLDAVQRLAAAAVVLEDAEHRVLDYRVGPGDTEAFLDDWPRRSRRSRPAERTAWDASNGWLTTLVGRPERRWGRLVIAAAAPPSPRLVAVAERGAAALAMHRLHERSRDGRLRRVHHDLLLALEGGPWSSDLATRAGLAGFSPAGHRLVGLALRPLAAPTTQGHAGLAGPDVAGAGEAAALDELVTACLRAAEVVRGTALVAAFETDVRALLAVPARRDPVAVVDEAVAAVRSRVGPGLVAAAGAVAPDLRAAGRSLREARQVLGCLDLRRADPAGVHRLDDLRVRGLLSLLGDDERVHTFAARQLEPLRDLATRERWDVWGTVRALVDHWGSKAAAAAALRVSRPVLYDRLARVERALGGSLGDAEVRTSLHLALLADEVLALRTAGPPDPAH